jgi:hypothetical protein
MGRKKRPPKRVLRRPLAVLLGVFEVLAVARDELLDALNGVERGASAYRPVSNGRRSARGRSMP